MLKLRSNFLYGESFVLHFKVLESLFFNYFLIHKNFTIKPIENIFLNTTRYSYFFYSYQVFCLNLDKFTQIINLFYVYELAWCI